ncbi:MFS transporter [Roseibium sp. M-1]
MTASAFTLEPPRTRWLAVFVIVGAGIVTALQVGKAAIAAPLLQSDLGIGLVAIGWLTGIFAVLGLVGGIPTGALAASFGGRRLLIIGLLTTVFGSGLGAVVSGMSGLLLARVIEGAGFLLVTVAAPSILSRVAKSSDRDLAFALWSCFMPVGMAIAMLTGPLFGDWRMIWWTSCLLTLIICVLVPWVVPVDDQRHPWSWRKLQSDTVSVFHAGVPVALAGTFALYSLMFFLLCSASCLCC